MIPIRTYPARDPNDWRAINRIARLAGLQTYSEQSLPNLIDEYPVTTALLAQCPRLSSLPMGFIVCRILPPEAELLDMAVTPSCQRWGIGHHLITVTQRHLAEKGVTTWFLEVRASNQSAQRFYSRHAFVPYRIRRGYYIHPKEDAILMKCTLDIFRFPVF